jgi:hypothetical protein
MGLTVSILLLGLVASLSPATILVFILVLGTARASVNAVAFLIGWAISLTIVFTGSYLLGSSRSTQHGSGRTGVLVIEVLVGCALVTVGVRHWRRRAEPRETTAGSEPPMLGGRLNDLGPRGAAVVGVLKQPWAITTAAAVVVVHHHEPRVVTLVAFASFAIASTASVGLMFLYYSRRPTEATAYLADLRKRVTAAGPVVFAVAAMVVGAFLALDGLVSLLAS